MRISRRWLVGGWLLTGLLVLGVILGPMATASSHRGPRPHFATVGKLAPTLIAPTLTGRLFRLSHVHIPVLLNFWASWCTFCRLEAPSLARVGAEAHGRYLVVSVNVTAQDSVAAARAFAAAYHLPVPILLDPTGAISTAYLVRVLPTTYYLNAQGRIVKRVIGFETQTMMQHNLQEVSHP